MSNIIKRVFTLFVVVGLICSTNCYSAKTVIASEETEIVKLSSEDKDLVLKLAEKLAARDRG